jgi:hypothetical protein
MSCNIGGSSIEAGRMKSRTAGAPAVSSATAMMVKFLSFSSA